MLGLLLDGVVIVGLAYLFNEGNTPGFGTAIGTAFGVALGFLGCVLLLGPYIGIFSVLPMIPIAAGLLWITCDVPIPKALIAGVILLVYKIAMSFLFAATGRNGGVAEATHLAGLLIAYLYLKGPTNLRLELKYRMTKWRMDRMRRKFGVHQGGRRDKPWVH